jgi:hypothetical protein
MIEAGAAGVHFEDQLSSAKKCGHMGGKVLVPTREFIQKLVAARLAADVMGVPTVVIARTDANGAADHQRHRPRRPALLTGERTPKASTHIDGGLECAISPRPGLRALRRRHLVRDRPARPGRGAAVRRGHARQVPRQAAGLQLLALLQLAAQPGRGDHRHFQASWARWATSSSSSRWPASTPSTPACSNWPVGYSATKAWRLLPLPAARVRAWSSTASAPSSTRALWAPATSTKCRSTCAPVISGFRREVVDHGR